MSKTFVTGCCALAMMTTGVAAAVPIAPFAEPQAPLVRVAGGCGPAFHRNFYGACVPNFYYGGPVRLPPPCPRFYHRDPDPARPICYPN